MRHERRENLNILSDQNDSSLMFDNEMLETYANNIPPTITINLEGKAPNFKLKENSIKAEELSKTNKSPNKGLNSIVQPQLKHNLGLSKIDKLVLKEVSEDYLKISIPLQGDLSSKENIAFLKDSLSQKKEFLRKAENKKDTKANIKVKKSFWEKIFGKNKKEKEIIKEQERLQREELRKKLNLVITKDKTEKSKISNPSNISVQNSTEDDGEILENINVKIDNENINFNKKNNFSKDLIVTPQMHFAFKTDIKQLELKLNELDLILGENILPEKFRRKRQKTNYTEPKEELSEIDKLYLSAFSDISLPDEELLPEEETIFLDDPVEMEELFDLADSSLTDSMENAILTQIHTIKQNIEESTPNKEDNLKQVAKELNEKQNQKQPINEVKVEKNLDNKKDLNQRITKKIQKISTTSDDNFKKEKTANFFVKASATFIDFIFLSFISSLFSLFTISSKTNINNFYADPLFLIDFVALFLKSLLLLSISYYAVLFTLFQTSLGLGLLSYKIKSFDNKKPKIRQILIRIFCIPMSIILLINLFKKTALHEKLSKTKLVKV